MVKLSPLCSVYVSLIHVVLLSGITHAELHMKFSLAPPFQLICNACESD